MQKKLKYHSSLFYLKTEREKVTLTLPVVPTPALCTLTLKKSAISNVCTQSMYTYMIYYFNIYTYLS